MMAKIKMLRAENEQLKKALERQCDNMAFVLHHCEIYNFHGAFLEELEEDRKLYVKKGSDDV